jgi:gamma-glutamyl hydrolase
VKFGISPQRLQTNDALSDFFRILTTTPDKDGKVVEPIKYFSVLILSSRLNFICNCLYQIYVSSVQAYSYPVTALQWHPEVYQQLTIE